MLFVSCVLGIVDAISVDVGAAFKQYLQPPALSIFQWRAAAASQEEICWNWSLII